MFYRFSLLQCWMLQLQLDMTLLYIHLTSIYNFNKYHFPLYYFLKQIIIIVRILINSSSIIEEKVNYF